MTNCGSEAVNRQTAKENSAASEVTTPLKTLSANTYPMPTCGVDGADGNAPPHQGVIRIRLPKRANFRNIDRLVRYQKGAFNSADSDSAGSDNKKTYPEPFHILIRKLNGLTNEKYIMVRVIIQDDPNTELSFYNETNLAGIHGVGASIPVDRVVCGSNPIEEIAGKRAVAIFYLNVEDFQKKYMADNNYSASFNIAVKVDGSPETPIFIDPKVHNDG